MDTVVAAATISSWVGLPAGPSSTPFNLSCPGIPLTKVLSSPEPCCLTNLIVAKAAVILLTISPPAYILVKNLESPPILLVTVAVASGDNKSPSALCSINLEVTSELLAIASVFILPKVPSWLICASALYSYSPLRMFFHFEYNWYPASSLADQSFLGTPFSGRGGIINSDCIKIISVSIRLESIKAFATVPLPLAP